ncbi:unnamed protein product [Callosobruchus maculatus]|uniref:Uncharacterized protein n=1 Tax=Callosobruchus maculatus TaxID=64391 RepID=A0A653BUC1_CALMS|nr:unnamed protein product [Callosobruchus maculatus]
MYRTDKPFLRDPVTACCRLKISGLSREVSPDDLEEIFSKYGKIVGMLVDPGLRFTFLQFEKEEQAIEAAEAFKHGMFVRNTYLDVRRVDKQLITKVEKQESSILSATACTNNKRRNDTMEVKKVQKHVGVWKQCHDELTGYSYYWNIETDEVTWQTPASFKPASKKDTLTSKDPPQHPQKTKTNLYVPPKTPMQPPGAVKIYSIGECSQQTLKVADSGGGGKKKKKTKITKDKESVLKKFLGRDSESEDEKIELITSYGGDTDSEPEVPPPKKNKHDPQESDHNEDDDDDLDILSQIKRAQALKNVSETKKKDISDSLKLVAGYSDSEEEEEPHESVVASKATFTKPESHSTLFPITEPINIKDFASPKTETEEKAPIQAEFIDAKLFQRKKRIGVALVNTGKKKEDIVEGDGERKGLGFSTSESQPLQPSSNIYPGFAKGGVMFVKSDVLQPSNTPESAADKIEKNNEEDVVNKKLVKDMYQTLQEKLGFLNVGAGAVSPVYTMIIQSEILYSAMNEGGLKLSYLQKWLQNTCTELVNLEKEATPEGWLLQWDRYDFLQLHGFALSFSSTLYLYIFLIYPLIPYCIY